LYEIEIEISLFLVVYSPWFSGGILFCACPIFRPVRFLRLSGRWLSFLLPLTGSSFS
jgi:hypothetical protein